MLKKTIKCRIIVEKESSPNPKELPAFLAIPNFQIRFIPKAPTSELTICDKKMAIVALLPDSMRGERTTLVTNHPGCLEMFQNHFDKIWNEAQDYNPQKSNQEGKIANKYSAKTKNRSLI